MNTYEWRRKLPAQLEAALVLIENADLVKTKKDDWLETEGIMPGWAVRPLESKRAQAVIRYCFSLLQEVLHDQPNPTP